MLTNGPTDRPTDGRTDGRADKASYKVACPKLKMEIMFHVLCQAENSKTECFFKSNILHALIPLFIHSSTRLIINLSINSTIHSSIHWYIYSFIISYSHDISIILNLALLSFPFFHFAFLIAKRLPTRIYFIILFSPIQERETYTHTSSFSS